MPFFGDPGPTFLAYVKPFLRSASCVLLAYYCFAIGSLLIRRAGPSVTLAVRVCALCSHLAGPSVTLGCVACPVSAPAGPTPYALGARVCARVPSQIIWGAGDAGVACKLCRLPPPPSSVAASGIAASVPSALDSAAPPALDPAAPSSVRRTLFGRPPPAGGSASASVFPVHTSRNAPRMRGAAASFAARTASAVSACTSVRSSHSRVVAYEICPARGSWAENVFHRFSRPRG